MHDLIPQAHTKWLKYISKNPVVEHPQVDYGNGRMETNFYRPNDRKKHAAVIFVHGVNELGKDDPRIVNLAETFSRVGFAVLVPGLPDMTPGKLNPEVISEIEASLRYIHSRDDVVATDKIGALGFSIGSGPTLIAVSEIEKEFPIKFLVSFGGYHDLKEVISFSTTGHFTYQGQDHYIEPDPTSRWFFVRYYSDFLTNGNDSSILKQIARTKISDPGTDVADLSGQLSPEGIAIFSLLTNTDPAKVSQLISDLPQQLQDFISELNPAEQVKMLKTNLFIVHSVNDNVIPYTQSLELENYLKEKTKTNFFLLSIFSHVNPQFPPLTLKNIFTQYFPETYKFGKLICDILGYQK
ncbi:MAG: hypothetical protein QMD77_01055 [Patescibacteria group bacterium]|nr:hypothetical protein [Patescibacteria group bacterium]